MKTCPNCKVTFQASETVCPYCGKPLESLSTSGVASCCASLGEIQSAKKDRLNEGLRSLARWCADRSNGDHDTDTTLTMLEKKATALRGRVIAAGWAEIERKNALSRHNAQAMASADGKTSTHQENV